MLDKILFWVVLVWMVALLAMAVWAVREVWKEDNREPLQDDKPGPPGTDSQDSANPGGNP
ncbi:MAG: hypothetical protein DME18_07395 [Verrucomicrobia bacterium]|nr:MAG: hypothetical protein DME18_07395 [Verrucomicrobiota bacterium]